jgi:hypothetical protein
VLVKNGVVGYDMPGEFVELGRTAGAGFAVAYERGFLVGVDGLPVVVDQEVSVGFKHDVPYWDGVGYFLPMESKEILRLLEIPNSVHFKRVCGRIMVYRIVGVGDAVAEYEVVVGGSSDGDGRKRAPVVWVNILYADDGLPFEVVKVFGVVQRVVIGVAVAVVEVSVSKASGFDIRASKRPTIRIFEVLGVSFLFEGGFAEGQTRVFAQGVEFGLYMSI